MARFNLSSIPRWAKAIASVVNTNYNAIRTHTLGALFARDALRQFTVDSIHTKQPLSFVVSNNNEDTGAVAIGAVCAEVFFVPASVNAKALCIGFVWNRRVVAGGDTLLNGELFIDRFNGAVYVDSAAGGYIFDGPHYSSGLGRNKAIASPQPGVAGFNVKYGGGQCVVTTRVYDPVPAGTSRFGLFAASDDPNHDGKCHLVAFIEDNGQ